jgi:putative membrane protein
MIGSALLSALHLFALAVGLPGIFLRARALGRVTADPETLKPVFAADNAWGLAALLWLGTGLARLFGSFEKGTAYYANSGAFWLKMLLFGLVFALETWPMIMLIRWRIATSKQQPVDISIAPKLQQLSRIELGLTVAIPFVASMMARGILFGWSPL